MVEPRAHIVFRTDIEARRISVDDIPARRQPDGTFVAVPVAPGTRRYVVFAPGTPGAEGEITIREGRRHELDVRLTEGATLRGVVVDSRGRTIAGAWVRFTATDVDRDFDAWAYTDRDGRFLIRGLRDARAGYVRVEAEGAGYVTAVVPSIRVPGDPVRIVLRTGPRVVGQLDPVPAYRRFSPLLVWGEDEAMSGWIPVDDEGRFEIRWAPPDEPFWLRIRHGKVPLLWRDLKVAPEQVLDLGTIRPRTGVTLSGRVEDESGAPLIATVTYRSVPADLEISADTESGTDGEFSFADLAPMEIEITAEANAHEPATARVRTDGGRVLLRLRAKP